MLMKKGTYPVNVIEHMKGGEGEFLVEQILTPEQLGEAGRMFVWGTLAPGNTVGWHVHHGDAEVCCCVRGSGVVIDEDHQEKPFTVGDVNFVGDGCGHEIRNTGDEPLTYIAAVLYPSQK